MTGMSSKSQSFNSMTSRMAHAISQGSKTLDFQVSLHLQYENVPVVYPLKILYQIFPRRPFQHLFYIEIIFSIHM